MLGYTSDTTVLCVKTVGRMLAILQFGEERCSQEVIRHVLKLLRPMLSLSFAITRGLPAAVSPTAPDIACMVLEQHNYVQLAFWYAKFSLVCWSAILPWSVGHFSVEHIFLRATKVVELIVIFRVFIHTQIVLNNWQSFMCRTASKIVLYSPAPFALQRLVTG